MRGSSPALRVVTSEPEVTPGHPNIRLIASGKGGVGKTWFATSLAHALAKSHKRVLLFDGDLGLANVDVQLGLMPETDLGAVIAGRRSLTDSIIKYEGGFDIIAGQSGAGDFAQLSKARLIILKEEIKKLANHYDHVLIDLGAGIGQIVKELSDLASDCYVVATNEPTSLTDAYAFIKVIHKHVPDLPQKIVINQADTENAGHQTYQTLLKVCLRFLNFSPDMLGIIRRDSHVHDAIRNQTPLLQRHPNCEAAQDITKISDRVARMY